MKKALVIANMLFASATVFGMNNFQTERSYNSEQTQRFVEALQQGNIEQIGQEIQNGADVNNIIVNKMTPLIFAIKSNNYDMVKTLVNKGRANIYQNGAFDIAMQGSEEIKDFIEYSNYCNLVKAVRNNDVDGVRSALNYGTTRVNEKFYVDNNGAKGYTPLMYAASRGNLDIVDLLRWNGARVNVVSDSGDNALFFAARNGKTEVLDRLIYGSISDLVAGSNTKEDLERKIKRAALVAGYRAESALTQRNDLDHTLLISALKNGREDTAIWLINCGADVNSFFYDTYNRSVAYKMSPLAIAKKYDLKKAVKKLKEKHAVFINMELPDKLDKSSERKYRRENNEKNYESSVNAASHLYERASAEAQAIAVARQLKRTNTEVNYENALELATEMYKSEDRKARKAEIEANAEVNYKNALELVTEMYKHEEKYITSANGIMRGAERRARRAEAEANYDNSLESATEMYELAEDHARKASNRRARRAEAESNYDSSLRAASRMVRKGKIAASKRIKKREVTPEPKTIDVIEEEEFVFY